MGEKRQNDDGSGRPGYTPVNGLAIAALIARAMPAPERKRIMARISAQSPVTGAALEASIEKIEGQIQARTVAVARQISTQLSLPETQAKAVEQAPVAATKPAAPTKIITSDPVTDVSPAEQLLQEREGSHEDLERELEKQRPTPGRRRIISA